MSGIGHGLRYMKDGKLRGKIMRGINIRPTLTHDGGAYARCSYCERYSDNPQVLSHKVICNCGKYHGWSGSFKRPTEKSIWSD